MEECLPHRVHGRFFSEAHRNRATRDAVTGRDPYGNPTWTSTTKLSPEQQQLYNYDVQSSLGLGALQGKGLDYVSQMIDQPFSTSSLPQLSSQLNAPTLQTTLGDQGMAGWDKATGLVMQRLAYLKQFR